MRYYQAVQGRSAARRAVGADLAAAPRGRARAARARAGRRPGGAYATRPPVRPRRLERVDVVLCAVPLERPIRLGATVYHEREYAALRLTASDGVSGDALGYTRGLPLAEQLERLAPSLVGSDADRPVQTLAALRGANASAGSALGRALSLVDIALRDAPCATCRAAALAPARRSARARAAARGGRLLPRPAAPRRRRRRAASTRRAGLPHRQGARDETRTSWGGCALPFPPASASRSTPTWASATCPKRLPAAVVSTTSAWPSSRIRFRPSAGG